MVLDCKKQSSKILQIRSSWRLQGVLSLDGSGKELEAILGEFW
jgi:hypothetical protein